MKLILLMTGAGMLSGCVSSWDMQGQDPQEYYAAHPVQNKVETRYVSHLVHFNAGGEMDADDRTSMHAQLKQVSPMAVDSIEVQLNPAQLRNIGLRESMRKVLVDMGLPGHKISYVAAEEVRAQDVNVQVAYAAVVSPRCPDWRPSPVTSYANMRYTPNIGCATTTNLGLMVADPRDLVEGEGDGTPDAVNAANAIQQYHESTSSSAGSSDASSSASAGTSAAGQ